MESVRCESMSRRGRCGRMTKDPSKKCHQHRIHGSTIQEIVDVPKSKGTRCMGKNKSGQQCRKLTNHENKRCHLHKDSTDIIENVPEVIIIEDTHEPPRPRRGTRRGTRERQTEGQKKRASRRTTVTIDSDDEIVFIKTSSKNGEEKSTKTEDCCVCYEPVPESDFLGCSHAVCKPCIGQLRDTRCPMCRSEIKNVSDKEKKKMARRKSQDSRERANELFRNFMIMNEVIVNQ